MSLGKYNKRYALGKYNKRYVLGKYNKSYVLGKYNKSYVLRKYDKSYVLGKYNKSYVLGKYNKSYVLGKYSKRYDVLGKYNKSYVFCVGGREAEAGRVLTACPRRAMSPFANRLLTIDLFFRVHVLILYCVPRFTRSAHGHLVSVQCGARLV